MWSQLKPFSNEGLSVELKAKAWTDEGLLRVSYKLTGDLEKILILAPEHKKRRVAGLWDSTCFEMFIKNKKEEQYLEFNASSDGHWNTFRFPQQRAMLKEYEALEELPITTSFDSKKFVLNFELPLDKLPPNFWKPNQMELGLTAVLETKDHQLSYWALHHADYRPNFHDPDSFIFHL